MNRSDYNHNNLQGTDVCLETSLKEYGLAWIEQDNTILFYYGIRFNDGDWTHFDFVTFEDDLDPTVEFDWVEWPEFFKYLGTTEEEWLQMPLTYQIPDLVSYYGAENIFGSSYWEGLTYPEVTGQLPDEDKR